jgi:serine/threonine protein kinase
MRPNETSLYVTTADAPDGWTSTRSPGDEPLPGYRLIEPLGKGGFGEVWKCEAPGGLYKAIKFVAEDPGRDGGPDNSLRQELDAFQRVRAIRHPFLLTLERVELVGGDLVMVMELADQSLQARFEDCRAAGLPGIPRDELLGYLADAAEALDLICSRFELQHLDIKPANLFLVCGHLKVGDYGLVSGLEVIDESAGSGPRRCFTPKYAAPEVLRNRIDKRSDQYSLALVYMELLTGKFPFAATSAGQLILHHMSADADLTPLPVPDRAICRRALAKKPEDRFPTCTEFIQALKAAGAGHTAAPAPTVAAPAAPGWSLASLLAHDTSRPGQDKTVPAPKAPPLRAPIAVRRDPAAELAAVFPGYKLVDEVESGPLGQVVRATAPDGKIYRIRMIRSAALTRDPGAQAVVATVQSLAHPGVVQQAGMVPGALTAFAAPEARTTLADLYRAHVAEGRSGLPRRDLLDVLAVVARTVDEVYRSVRLTHLLLQPSSVLIENDAILVTDFGLGEALRLFHTGTDWVEKVPYAAPELRTAAPGPASDQFSLALIALEMIHAWKPSSRRSVKDSIPVFASARLPDAPVRVMRKALHPDPAHRFPDCSRFVAALREAIYPNGPPRAVLHKLPPAVAVARLAGARSDGVAAPPPAAIVQAAAQAACPPDSPDWVGCEPVQMSDGSWLCRFPVKPTAEVIELKLRALAEEGQFEVSRRGNALFGLCKYHQQRGMWGSFTGKRSGVELVLRLPTEGELVDGIGRADIRARLVGSPAELGVTGDTLPALVEGVRKEIQNVPERRRAVRVPSALPLVLHPVNDEGEVLQPVPCRGRDLSTAGFSCLAPVAVLADNVYVEFHGVPGLAGQAVLARVVRTDMVREGEFLVAGQFTSATPSGTSGQGSREGQGTTSRR